MTKNKKRKAILRAIAENEGVGIARAGMLHDRSRSSFSPIPSLEKAIDWEKNLSWSLDSTNGYKIHVPFTADSPHVLINGGLLGQRHLILNEIMHGVYNRVSTQSYILTPQAAEGSLEKLNKEHLERLGSLKETALNSIADVRIKSLTEHGIEYMKRDAWKYFFLLIPEVENVFAVIPDETKEILRGLIADGRKSGIHVIAYTDGTSDETNEMFDSASVREIIAQDGGDLKTDYAVMMIDGYPVRIKIDHPLFARFPDVKW